MTLDLNKIYYGDCLEVMKSIDDKSIDMVLCDLPYNQTKNAWDVAIDLNKLWGQYLRISKSNSAIVLFGQGMFTADVMYSNKKMWRYNLIWNKKIAGGFLNANRMPLRVHEDIMVFYNDLPLYNPQKTKGSPNHSKGKMLSQKNNNYGNYQNVDNNDLHGDMKFPTSIIEFQKVHPSKCIHPTEKSVELLKWLINTYTNPDMIVLDNCCGSGSTCIASLETKRNYIGIEKEEQYFTIAQNRINKWHQDKLENIDLFSEFK